MEDWEREMMSRSVLVLGGASEGGIGAGIVKRLNEMGHQTYAPTQQELDVTDTVDAFGQMALILDEFKPDSVVYSVGVNQLDWLHSITRETFGNIMSANVWGFINVLKALENTGDPYSVLAVTSDAARRPMRTSMAYCASKAALDMVIRIAARELSVNGWRINGLAPGKVDGTAMTRYVDDRVLQIRPWSAEYAEEYEIASSPIGRKLSVAEVASVACDILLSPSMGWTGDIITVNGGR
jgi:NAD(P)-dependent dehydrogenase (short-subunit alcohol dehydrogenase family)